MKKIARTIAVILILAILAGSFTSCLSYWGKNDKTGMRVLYAVVDIIFLPISLIALLVYIIITEEDSMAQGYMAGLDNNVISEYYNLSNKMRSLPEEELSSLMNTLSSIPDAQRSSTFDKFSSLSESKLVSLAAAYKALPESVMISSIDRIKALPQEELISLLNVFNSLTDTEIDSIVNSINQQSDADNIALTDSFSQFAEIAFAVTEPLEIRPVKLASVLY